MEEGADLSSCARRCRRAKPLPGPVYEQWMAKTGKPMLDGIGATEMLHIFISNRFEITRSRPAPASRSRDTRRVSSMAR
jgi:2-aminobenzoate-CoA ligase